MRLNLSINVFISYNVEDAAIGRRLGAQLKLVGADVWFDEWEIRAGDSLIGAIDEALPKFDIFVLLWSEHAARSDWVRSELEAALARRIPDRELRVVPVLLDDAPLPPLLTPLKYVRSDSLGAATKASEQFTKAAGLADSLGAATKLSEQFTKTAGLAEWNEPRKVFAGLDEALIPSLADAFGGGVAKSIVADMTRVSEAARARLSARSSRLRSRRSWRALPFRSPTVGFRTVRDRSRQDGVRLRENAQ